MSNKNRNNEKTYRKDIRDEKSLKSELIEYLLSMVKPLENLYTEENTKLHLGSFAAGYGVHIADMEGLARVLWGLTPLVAGGHSYDLFEQIYIEAIGNGTNPKHHGFFGKLSDKDQRIVEMAAISFNLLMAKEWVWDNLDSQQQDNLVSWLSQINNYEVPDNNWHFFSVITNVALKTLGKPYDHERIKLAIDRYEAFYLEDGWYSDGVRPQKDYYTSFGIHFYCMLYVKYMYKDDTNRCDLYIERAKLFAKTFIYWFDDQGKALPFGRSQTYRFAQVAFWSIFVTIIKDKEWLSIAKGIIARHFRYWMKQPIFDNGGILTVGYSYPNLNMSEGYNAPGSPYWAFKSFFCLSLEDNHPFWEVKEQALPRLDNIKAIIPCDMIFQHEPGNVVALTSGQYPTVEHTHSPAKYAKFAYSSNFGFSVPRSNLSLEETAPDSMLAFRIKGMIYVRRRCQNYKVTEQEITSIWVPYEGIRVESVLRPIKGGHIRQHTIYSDIECEAFECGFSYPIGKTPETIISEHEACVYDKNGYSKIYGEAGQGIVIRSVPNTNIIYPLVGIPAIQYSIEVGKNHIRSTVKAKMENKIPVIGKGDCYEL